MPANLSTPENPGPPKLKRPSKSQMIRNMNRDLLLGLLLPGPDRFEVRGWVRILLGNPGGAVPDNDDDKQRVVALNHMDDEQVEALRDTALAAVQRTDAFYAETPHARGVQAHDHLMVKLLEDSHDMDSVRLAALQADTDQLLAMLAISKEDLDNDEFLAGFQQANHSLARVVTAAMGVDE